ncbi:MAG: long-chain fatty acid--CoA ligase [Candidatus Ancaeobacter aquaticus]|nr:long-chain fatty acid--CoA ligase [Candidatus Ancaeobacter aquaticus]
MTLIELLERSVSNYSNHPAYFYEKNKVTYADLKILSEKIAGGLQETCEIKKDDRVCLLMTNGPDFIPTFFGILKTGAWVVPVNTFLAPEEIKFIIEDSGAKVIITTDDLIERVKTAVKDIDTPITIIHTGTEHKENYFPLEYILATGHYHSEFIIPDDVAVLIYTSGTTGNPKAAVLTHNNLTSNIADCNKILHLTKRDRFIVFLPMFHSFTMTVCLLLPLSMGASIVILKSVKPFDKVLKTILFKRITAFVGIPQIYHLLGEKKLPWIVKKLIAIRFCISGSAPLSEEVLTKFEENTGLPLMEGYGLSESSPVVSVNPLHGQRKVSSVGPPLTSVKVKIVDDSNNEVPIGESGEICVMGPNVMREYYNNPEATAQTLVDGWLHTGDIGKVDEDGYIYILDRKKDMILSHGLNIYPREIEQVLYRHPAIQDAAIIGMKDPHRGELPVAYVTLKEGKRATAPELKRFCKDKLATYKIPHKINIEQDLPRTSTGKILKREIKKGASLL